MSSSSEWKGAPLSMIYGSESPWGAPEFPPVQPGHNHVVLYHIPSNGVLAEDRPPKPQLGQDRWDQNHVRLPCSKHSLYPVADNKGGSRLRKRWAIIENALNKPILNSQQLANAILSYNTKFKSRWKFRALHKLFKECLEEEESKYFFDVTLPEIIKLTLDLPKLIQAPIPLLKQLRNMSVSMSQLQISSLMANAFLCTFPRRNSMKHESEYASYPLINFNSLYETSGSDDVMEKLKCICFYFKRVCTKVPVGVVTFTRRSVPPRCLPRWAESSRPIATLPLHVDPCNTIEDADGLIQVDFANKYLGGGVLGHGCVQEEIRFVICPELMVSMLFTEVLRPNEAVMIIGSERYSRYEGYGHSFEWAGEMCDVTPRDSSGRRRCALLAVDALPYGGTADEFRRDCVTRELNKAWVGFSFFNNEENEGLNFPGMATGNWGCGAFGGTAQLKSLLQIMACAQARRPIAYYTFMDSKLRDDIISMYSLLVKHNVTVGQLYRLLVQFCYDSLPSTHLHSFLSQMLKGDSPKITKTESLENVVVECIQLNESIKSEFFDSPDMFSLDITMDEKSDSQEVNQSDVSNKNAEEIDLITNDDKMASVSSKMAASDCNIQPDQTSRLFQEMEKLDEGNGSLNLKSTHTLSFGHSADTSSSSDAAMDTERIQLDLSVEAKKKISRKITDYFAKKSI